MFEYINNLCIRAILLVKPCQIWHSAKYIHYTPRILQVRPLCIRCVKHASNDPTRRLCLMGSPSFIYPKASTLTSSTRHIYHINKLLNSVLVRVFLEIASFRLIGLLNLPIRGKLSRQFQHVLLRHIFILPTSLGFQLAHVSAYEGSAASPMHSVRIGSGHSKSHEAKRLDRGNHLLYSQISGREDISPFQTKESEHLDAPLTQPADSHELLNKLLIRGL